LKHLEYNRLRRELSEAAAGLDHGALTGLSGDDHLQYHNDARGDARYVNLTGDVLGGDLDFNGNHAKSLGIVHSFPAGEAISVGEVCYLDSSGKMSKAVSTTDATCSTLIAISLENTALDATGEFLLHGVYVAGAHGLSVGSQVYVGTTAGTMEDTIPNTAGSIVRMIGYATSTTEIYLEPDKTWIELG
jgi:hypothetical protein